MKNVFEQLITDFHHEEWPVPDRRDIKLPDFPDNIRKAIVFVGMRRSGKTWSMYQQMRGLTEKGVDREKLLYLNFEDDRLTEMTSKDFQSILDAFFSLYPHLIDCKNLHFFFDEIHEINGWEKFIRRLLDKEKMTIYLSGSSSRMLSKEIASTLRGRTITHEIFPFSFREYLWFQQLETGKQISSKKRSLISHHLSHYLEFGGFPETFAVNRNFHRELLQGYIDVVIYRDIIERYNITNTIVVRELLKYCIQNAASLISINKVFQRFKTQGKKVGKNSLYQYMQYFEDAFCVFSVPMYSHSLTQQSVNPKKIYVIDPGFITAYTVKPAFEEASRLENSVFIALRRIYKQVFYYQTRSGKEIDFLIVAPDDGTVHLFQVCVSISSPDTRKRELDALMEALDELSPATTTLITRDQSEIIDSPKGVIQCVSIQNWLLDLED